MKKDIGISNTAIRFFILVVILFGLVGIIGSGGGGGEGDGNGSASDNAANESLRTIVREQSEAGEEFFTAFEETLLLMEEADRMIASSDLSEVSNRDTLAEMIGSRIPDALEKMDVAGPLLVESENDLLRLGSTKSSKVLPVLLVACGAALTAYSWAETLNDNQRVYFEEMRRCFDQWKAGVESIPGGLSQASLNEYHDYYQTRYQQCMNRAKQVVEYEDLKAHTETLLSTLLSEFAPVEGVGKAAIQSVSSAFEVTNIYILGTSDDKSDKRRSMKENTGTHRFIAKSDENGEFYAPMGDWQMVFFKPGYLRVMTQTNQPFTVSSNRINQAQVDMKSIEDATHEEVSRCPVNGDESDGGSDDSGNGFPIRFRGQYNYHINMVITEPEYFQTVVCDYTGPADIVANADGSLTVVFGEENRDSLCAMPLLEPSGTHRDGRFTIPLGQITLTGVLDDSMLTGSGSFRVNQGTGYTETTISLNLGRS